MAKRALDVTLALLLLLLLAPVLLLTALAVLLALGRPVLFRQVRPGLHGRPFTLVKFRTMAVPKDDAELLLDDGPRLGRFGRVLRASSLDELPELWLVLRGDMSLVGPRPLLLQYLDRYTPEQARRHEVRPGITGLAQVRGRNALPWEDRLALDVEYVDTRSLRLDLVLLAQTLACVLVPRGVTAEGSASAPLFTGVLEGPARERTWT